MIKKRTSYNCDSPSGIFEAISCEAYTITDVLVYYGVLELRRQKC